MLRRIATVLLVVTVALGGLVSNACANATCAQMTRARMRCCPTDGLQQARNCCDTSVGKATPAPPAALERAPEAPAPMVLPVILAVSSTAVFSAPRPTIAPAGIGPPDSLLRQYTSLLL